MISPLDKRNRYRILDGNISRLDKENDIWMKTNIDSVLPSFYGMNKPEFLQAMYDKWFKLDPDNYTYYKMDNGNVAAIVGVKDGKETKTWEWLNED
jgi:hypothetical protein